MEHSALSVTTGELMFLLAPLAHCAMLIAVAIASYRRCRSLSKYPIWKSLLIGAVAGWFWLPWMLFWLFDRKQIAQEWRDYRASQLSSVA